MVINNNKWCKLPCTEAKLILVLLLLLLLSLLFDNKNDYENNFSIFSRLHAVKKRRW